MKFSWYQTIFKQAARRETPIESLKPDDITFKTKASCPIFGFVYGPYPMLKIDKFGFGFLVPTTKAIKGSEVFFFFFINVNINLFTKWKFIFEHLYA